MTTRRSVSTRARPRDGHTLLELVAASTLVSIAIVSTLSIMRQSIDLSLDAEDRAMVTTLCVSKLEEHLSAVAGGFVQGNYAGNFAAEGYPSVRFVVVRSSNPVDGGIADALMVVSATVWMDNNGDGAISSAEPVITMRSKIAKITAWEI